MENQNILEVHGLCKKYKKFAPEQVDLVLPKGCIMGFVGENGAGKTTTLKCILDIAHRDSGSVDIFGQDSRKADMEDIGVVFVEMNYQQDITGNNINTMYRNIYRNWQEDTFFGYLDLFGIDRKKAYKTASRGMQLKLQLAVALSHRARLLLLDEPTSGLDPVVRDEMLEIFQDFIMDEEHSILFSTHITSDLEKIADYVVMIHEGRVIFSEQKDTLLYQYGIWKGNDSSLAKLPKNAVLAVSRSGFGVSALVNRKKLGRNFEAERPSIDEIMLHLIKGEQIWAE